MLVHIDSTAIHVYDVKEENRSETKFLRVNGIFLNFANETIHVQVEVYIPKNNTDWLATATFSPNDVIEVTGTRR